MKFFDGKTIKFTIWSRSDEGDYLMVKNATAENTWWKKPKFYSINNAYSTPTAAVNNLLKRFENPIFFDLYKNDVFAIVAVSKNGGVEFIGENSYIGLVPGLKKELKNAFDIFYNSPVKNQSV